MARKEKIETEVEFRPKGLGELKAKWADFAGDLLEPVVMLAAGATKAQAAWAGMRGIFESRVLGPLGLVAAAIWLLTAALLRMSSLAALVASAATPLVALMPTAALKLPAPLPIVVLAAFTAVLIWVRHHENIARLLKGVEPRIGAKSA